MKKKYPITGKKLQGKAFKSEDFEDNCSQYPFVWYKNMYGQLINIENGLIYEVGTLLEKFIAGKSCAIIHAKMFDNNRMGVVVRNENKKLFYATIALVDLTKTMQIIRVVPLNVEKININFKTWYIINDDRLAAYSYDNHLNIYTIR